jgi:hypothetical protein
MEPNELYDEYIDSKFKPELDELKKIAATRASRYFFGYFHQLNTGRPLGVATPDKPLTRTGRKEFASSVPKKILHENPTRLYTRLK